MIPTLVREIKDGGYDMAVGARTGKDDNIPLERRPAKFILKKLADYRAETKIPDLNQASGRKSCIQVLSPAAVGVFTTTPPRRSSRTAITPVLPIDYSPPPWQIKDKAKGICQTFPAGNKGYLLF
jgi:hypothetical protein